MKKSMIQKFLDFKNRHNLSNAIITKMITEYANSDLEKARTYFAEKYRISVSVFYKCRDFAVIFGLVDNATCKKLRNKTATNYSMNNSKSTARASLMHFEELLKERKEVFNGFSENEIKDIGQKYIEGVSVQKIAICYDVGEYAIKYLLGKGVVELILDGDTVKRISAMLGVSVNEILQKREKNKKALVECLMAEINFLNQQIKCYDAYMRIAKDKQSKEDLQKKLSETKVMYQKALQL